MKRLLQNAILSFALAWCATVRAASFEVTSLADAGAGTLREAVLNANGTALGGSAAHLITFQSGLTGTINLDTALDNVAKTLNLVGPGASQITIRRNGTGTYGALYITDYVNCTNLAVTGLTFKNFNRNEGAIGRQYGSVTVTNCVFDSNNSSGSTAGLWAQECENVAVVGCVFTNNSGNNGVAMRISGPTTFTVKDCVIVNNTSSGYSAGLYASAGYYVDTIGTITGCTFAGNSTTGAGGAAEFGGSGSGRYHQFAITNCTFSGNYASIHSGAIANGSPYLRLWNCTISGNTAGSYAGGVNAGDNFSGGYTTFINCTVTGNRCGLTDANGYGGGIVAQANTGRAILRNTIVAGNEDLGLNAYNPDVSGGFTSQGWNFIGVINGSPDFVNSTDIIGSAATPAKPRLSALGDFGGSTKTHVLMYQSPALDKGNVSGLNLTADQRGLARVVDEPDYANAAGGDGSDIGATERYTALNSPPTIALDPLDSTLKASSNLVLTAGAIGSEPIYYQWRKNGVPIPGATSNELSIVNIQPWDGAGYDFVASNAFGAQTSKVALVTVVYFRVSNLNDSGAGSLRQALLNAEINSGADSIYFLDDSLNPITGTINLDSALPNITQSLDIIGPGAAQLAVRRNGTSAYRLLYALYGSGGMLNISGLTLQNAKESGGALYQRSGALRLADCVFDGNDGNGSGGAAVYTLDLSQVTVTNCIVTNNFSGGGAFFLQGTHTNEFIDCQFVNNSTTFGGVGGALAVSAMAFGETRTIIDRCTFSGNSAWAAGAITFSYPSAYGYTYYTTIRNSTFSGNTAFGATAGAIGSGCPNLLLINCTLSGNTAYGSAGAIHGGDNFSSGRVTLQNCTVTGNRCGTGEPGAEGGGILVGHSTPRLFLRNTIVAGNTDSGVNFNYPDVFASAGAMVSQGWNLIGMTNGCPDFTNSTDIVGSVAAPVNPLLAPLANYGGPTLTHMPFAGSPVLDKGNVSGLNLTNDQRGLPRVVDEALIANAAGGDGSDIGATEGFVSSPLQITQQPQSLTVQLGQTATFTVLVSGTPLGYQWRKNGMDLSVPSAGTLTIANAQTADTGIYSVVISNAVSTLTSSDATLAVTLPPTITTDLLPISVISGQPGCLEIAATGPGPLTYQFRKDGVVISTTSTPRLLFQPTTTANNGQYDVIITGSGGSVTSAVVNVKAWIPPAITQQPSPVTVNSGQTAMLSVGVTGTSPIEYQWRRNGVPVPGANSSTLTLTGVQPFQAGTYDVVVGNGGGSMASTPVSLTVNTTQGSGAFTWSMSDIHAQHVYGGSSGDSVNIIIPTSDGGYLLGGGSSSGTTGNKTTAGFGGTDGWVVKVDASGNKLWDTTLGGLGNEAVLALSEASNGGYIVGLISDSSATGNKSTPNYGGTDYWVVKLNANGGIVWDRDYGNTMDDSLYAVARTTDGGCLIGGYSRPGATGNRTDPGIGQLDFWVLKLDSNGDKQWERSYGGTGNDNLFSLLQTADGGYLLSGDSDSGVSGNKTSANQGGPDWWLVKVDANGDITWDKTFGGTASDQTPKVSPTQDGGYVLAGKTQSGVSGNKTTPAYGSYDVWVMKVDANGTKQWEQTIGDASTEYPYSISQTSDGGYILSGNLGSSSDTSVAKLDSGGAVLWSLPFGGNQTESNGAVIEATGGDFVLATTSPSGISGNKTEASLGGNDMWFVQFAGAHQSGALPVLHQVPTNQTARVGGSVSLSVTAGNGPTSYVWKHDGNVIPSATGATLDLSSLQLTDGGTYSVTVGNGDGNTTSPDFTLTVIQDTDGDGLPDDWELANGTSVSVSDVQADPDGDGMTNLQEYLAGTKANDFNSKLVLGIELDDCGTTVCQFDAVANHSYTLQYKLNLNSTSWLRALDVFPAQSARTITFTDNPSVQPNRIYRVVTPMVP